VANELNRDVLRRFAKLGALARLEQIEVERKAILATFPDLVARRGRAQAGTASSRRAAAPAARRRRRMTAAQRKEVSERMKKYWADRKKKG
jgi:hypothetical protein